MVAIVPAEVGYEQRVAPGGAATGAAQAGPDAFGAGVGAAIGSLGDTIDKLQTQRQNTAAGLRAANARLAITKGVADLKTTIGPDDPAYAGAVADLVDSHQDSVLAGITHARVREAQSAQWTEFADQAKGEAYETSQVAQQAKSVGQVGQQTDVSRARLAIQPTDQALGDEVLAIDNSVDSIHGPASLKEKARSEAYAKIGVPMMQARILNDPSAAKDDIESGRYNQYLGEHVAPLLASATVAIRTQDAQARALAAQQRTQAVKATDLDAATLRQGRGTFDQWTGIAAKYDALAEPEKALDARGQGAQIAASEAYRGASPVDRQARIDALAAKPTRTAQEGNELKGLLGQQTLLQSKSVLDRAAYATGKGLAPIDWSNPASIQQRIADYAAADQHFGGGGPPLTDQEIAPVKAMIASGSRDQMVQAAHAILNFGPISRQVLDQAAGSNHEFRSAVLLAALPRGSDLMDLALQGPDALRAAPGLLTPAKDAAGHEGPHFNSIFASTGIDAATKLLPNPMRADILDNTRNLYLAFGGKGAYPNLNRYAVIRAQQFAMGGLETGNGWAGGLGTWKGQSVVLPHGILQADFDRRIMRSPAADWAAASLHGAPWVPSQNRTMSTGEIRSLTPVTVGNGRYALRQADGSYVATHSGARFEFDINKLTGIGPAPLPTKHPDPRTDFAASSAAAL